MPAQASETIILRTYPLKEADLIVSFFTRDQGKLRGVAKRARRPRNNFGSGLERLSQVRMYYYQRENRELVNLDSCELIQTQFGMTGEYAAGIVMDYLAEVAEHLLPPHEPSEKYFRLLLAVLEHLRRDPAGHVWSSLLYYSVWAVRLSGFLPDPEVTAESREIIQEMLTKPIADLTPRRWSRATAADARRFLIRSIEEHAERRLITPRQLEAL